MPKSEWNALPAAAAAAFVTTALLHLPLGYLLRYARVDLFPRPLLALAALAIFILAGCGSSSSSSSTSPMPSATATTATASWTPADLAAIKSDPAIKAMLPSNIASANNLRVASDVPYPPWEYYDPATSKNPAGFDYDLSQAIGAKIGIHNPQGVKVGSIGRLTNVEYLFVATERRVELPAPRPRPAIVASR